jgi:basic endochitinase B
MVTMRLLGSARLPVALLSLVLVGSTGGCASSPPDNGGNSGNGGSSGSKTGGSSGSQGGSTGNNGGTSGGQGGNAGSPSGSGGSAPNGSGGAGTPASGGATGNDGGGGAPDAAPATCGTVGDVPGGNRCTKTTKAVGNEPLIDDFEPGPNHTATCDEIRKVDGRSGTWNSGKDTTSPMGAVVQKYEAPGAEGATGSTRALHVSGNGLNGWGGFLAVPVAPCYDASAYKGISFWFKGDPSKAPWLKVSVITPPTAQATEGGTCVQGAGAGNECYDHFSVHLFKVSNIWTRYAITWQQLAQYGWGQNVARTVRPETQIIGINFSPVWDNDAAPNKGFDFWVDDVSFDVEGAYADSGFKKIVSKSMFDQAFMSNRAGALNPLYANAYDDLATALNDPRFSRVGREGTAEDRKREIAAFMAHVVQETGSLQYAVELAPQGIYCRSPDPAYPCSAGKTYIGRGPMQLTWNYNYGQASEYFGLGNMLLTNPDKVGTDGPLSWKTALFFWMAWKDKDKNALLVGPHSRFLKEGFGASIKAVNGALECPSSPAADKRRQVFQSFCTLLGVTGCNQNLACPAI